MKATLLIGIMILLPFAFAIEDFSEAKSLVSQNIPCNQLTIDQLEEIGDYYMDLMHPGEIHERMNVMMGGEGSETLRQAHINIAQRFYCNQEIAYSNSYGMMGRYNRGYSYLGSITWFVYVALAAFIFGIVFWWTYRLVVRRGNKKRG